MSEIDSEAVEAVARAMGEDQGLNGAGYTVASSVNWESAARAAIAAMPSAADRIAALESALRDCADDLEAEVNGRYADLGRHPDTMRRWKRDLASVEAARATLSDGGDHAR